MFHSQGYDHELIENAKSGRFHREKACRLCASSFCHDAYRDFAYKVTTRSKLVNWLSWQYETIGLKQVNKLDWIKDCFKAYKIPFKKGII